MIPKKAKPIVKEVIKEVLVPTPETPPPVLKGWRTILFNTGAVAAPAAIDVVGQLLNLHEVQNIIPDQWLPYYMFIVAVVNIYLRLKTTTAVGQK